MRFASKVALAALVLVLGGVSTGWAVDVCFIDTLPDGQEADLLVAKAFAMPTAGTCKPVYGYYGDTAMVVSGVACGTSDNSLVRFDLRYSKFRTAGARPFVYHALAWVSRTGWTGQVEYLFDNDTNSTGAWGFRKIACPVASDRKLN